MLWLLWVAGLDRIFWLAVVALLLPKAISIGQSAVGHLLRPADDDGLPTVRRGVLEVCVERGLRVVLIAAAAYWLAHVWGVDVVALSDRDNIVTRLVRGALTSVVVLIVADFIWQVVKAVIDREARRTPAAPQTIGTEAAVRQARMRTLLPIFRNILFVVIVVMAGLMALSALGVEIGPLIAGAGVVGVAVGFGAQTLVKDIISGIFYLLDDAFRVGEYIQSGNYKGTVESFSLRSVKLRHHRGPVYTVPFGELGAVQNMSRDWVIDKFTINVTYDTDLEKARKLDQEDRPGPRRRSGIRHAHHRAAEDAGRRAVRRLRHPDAPEDDDASRASSSSSAARLSPVIKQAFDENGIHFAFPTVQVSGGGDDQLAAAARQSLDRMQQEKPAA